VSDQFLDVDDEPPVEEVGIESILNQVLDLVATAKSMPLSSSVMVSRDEVSSLVQSALECLPDELRQARWLLREREEFMAERNREAETLMDDVRAQAEHMVQRTEIVLDRLTRTVQAGRARLAAPPLETTPTVEATGTEEDGFFDQDKS